jgi:YegS/Rv2252/BmrU family lipid kinase
VPDERPFVLVVNPRAGGGRAERVLSSLEAALRDAGARFETSLTRGQGDATRIVREAIADRAGGVAVVGGDGTFNEAVNGFFGEDGAPVETDAWLGPLPCGTGGDFRKVLGLGTDTIRAARGLLRAEPRRADAGWISFRDREGATARRAFLNIASFGVAGLVDELVNTGPKWMGGTAAFFVATLRALQRWTSPAVRVEVDGETAYEGPITNVAVANGQYFGGGMRIAPTASIDDGLFDVVCIEKLDLAKQARLTRHLYGDTVLTLPFIHHARGKVVVAELVDPGAQAVSMDVDGETPGLVPARFEIRPGAIRLRA